MFVFPTKKKKKKRDYFIDSHDSDDDNGQHKKKSITNVKQFFVCFSQTFVWPIIIDYYYENEYIHK